jgi:AcrR family transcriptional regulator
LNTKEKILKTALALFNAKGTEMVTVREIAKMMGISHGNLCYHFPTTDHIIKQLYFNLVAELDAQILTMQKASGTPINMFSGARILFELLYDYKFLLLNFVDIMRRMPDIKKHYKQLQKRRKDEFKVIFAHMAAADMMRPELYPGFFDDFNVNMTILGDFWISHAEILYEGKEKDKLNNFFRVTGSILLPLLTEKGLALFLQSTPMTNESGN